MRFHEAHPLVLEHYAAKMPNEPVDSGGAVTELANQVSTLFNQVADMDLPKPLKKWLLELLHAMQQGIQRFFISGAKGLQREFFKIMGVLSERYRELEKVKPETAKSLSHIIEYYANVTTILGAAQQVITAGVKLLGLSVGGNAN